MAALRNARIKRDGQGEFTTVASMAEQYTHLQRCDADTDIVIAEDGGVIVGYARTMWDDVTDGFRDYWLIIEADFGRPDVETTLIDWCEQRALAIAADHPAGNQRLVAEAADGGERQHWLVERGFTPLRYDATMIRSDLDDVPDRPLPDGVAIRSVGNDDLRTIWEADREALRDHRGYVEATEADWAMFLDSITETGTSLWQVAWAGNEVVGQVRTYVNEGDEELWGRRRAWTEYISTHRDWRGRGIASAVICASLRQLAELGFEEAFLGVDTENPTGAFSLYESLGYRIVATEVFYHRPIGAEHVS
jgi:ribosomal protein S18 acetylase RimI-like enzyme